MCSPGALAASKKRRQPRPLLPSTPGRQISFRERQKQVRYVPQQPRRRTYDWQHVTPAQKFEPSGELELLVSQQSGYSYEWKKEWADTAMKPLEEQIGSVFRALKARVEERERARLEREAEQQPSGRGEPGSRGPLPCPTSGRGRTSPGTPGTTPAATPGVMGVGRSTGLSRRRRSPSTAPRSTWLRRERTSSPHA